MELMVVIIIIGVAYALLVQNLNLLPKTEEKLNIKNLSIYLDKKFKQSQKIITLLCQEDCQTCFIYENGVKKTRVDGLLKNKPQTYIFKDDEIEKQEFTEEKTCFKYNLYPNKSSDEIILEYKDKFYHYQNTPSMAKEYKSLDDIREAREKFKREIFDAI